MQDMRTKKLAAVMALALVPVLSPARASAERDPSRAAGYFTKSQAAAGHAIFERTCAICHGANLEGGVGPALAGKLFLSVSQYQQITADYFYHFMSTHMPQTDPGSLSKTQYLDIMAFFLETNGYAAGPHKLTANDQELKGIKIEPQH